MTDVLKPLLLLLLLISFAGCQTPDASASAAPKLGPATLEPGWILVDDGKSGFTVGLPPGWEWKDISKMESEMAVNGNGHDLARGRFSQIAAMYLRERDGVMCWTTTGDMAFLALNKETMREDWSVAEGTEALKKEIVGSPIKPQSPQTSTASSPYGEAGKLTGEMDGSSFGEPDTKFTVIAYIIPDGRTKYTALFLRMGSGESDSLPTQKILDTFRIK